ncbi:MAG: response regulator transcription factor [Alphaproteobacteria bacterium]|nr:MAG: response regulator transcription factor [Alphaproteobacteria bacterium]
MSKPPNDATRSPARSLAALVVDDEAAIRRFLRSALVAEGFEVTEARDLATARHSISTIRFDVAVLDLGLPDGNGADLIGTLQAAGAPAVIVLSALDDEPRKVAALDAGADDFVSKPFGVAEFMARVRAALRHRVQMQGGTPVYDDGRLFVDISRRIVKVDGVDPKLTPREYALLHELILHAGKVLTHRHLLSKAWPSTQADVQTLRVHIRHLRQKVEVNADQPDRILTEPGVGYRLSQTPFIGH